MTIRDTVKTILAIGFPSNETMTDQELATLDKSTKELESPATNDEALALFAALPSDSDTRYGMVWAVLSFIETTADWAAICPADGDGEWRVYMRERLLRAKSRES